MSDQYKTLAAPSTGEFKDRGSKFFAYAFPVETEMEIATALEQVKKEHFKARHHCYAYRLGMDKNNFRANDDGEPSGTAGRPILGQIDSWELTDVFIVVVRYFGGTKLGTSGLINAYKKSAIDALEQAEIITKTIKTTFKVAFDYAIMGDVMSAAKKLNLEVVHQEFEVYPFLQIAIPLSEIEQQLLSFKALVAKMPEEQVLTLEEIPHLKIEEM
ncbi:MAG: YigZ family protein [Bacteroidota bacterium]